MGGRSAVGDVDVCGSKGLDKLFLSQRGRREEKQGWCQALARALGEGGAARAWRNVTPVRCRSALAQLVLERAQELIKRGGVGVFTGAEHELGGGRRVVRRAVRSLDQDVPAGADLAELE